MIQVSKGKAKICLLLLIFLLFTTYNLNIKINLPFFKIKNIDFRNQLYLEENIKSDIIDNFTNKSLINLSKKNLNKHFEKSKWVDSYKLKKKYPNTILIILNEHKPIAIYSKDNLSYLVNNNYILTKKIINTQTDIDLINLKGEFDAKQFKDIYSNLITTNFLKKVKEIKIKSLNRMDLLLFNNIKVSFGEYSSKKQIEVLKQILKKYPNIERVDLRNEGRVVIK
jgi:cell division septal protein FtsQ